MMKTVPISSQYEVVIPKQIRERFCLLPGQELHVIAHAGRIELIPVRPIRELRGSLKGLDTSIERSADRV